MPEVKITNSSASAVITLLGAQVISFIPQATGKDLLWLSPLSAFKEGTPIRGGIPICWPWFGPQPTDSSKPAHGFARNKIWKLDNITQADDGRSIVVLSLDDSPETRALWPYAFHCKANISVGNTLSVALAVENTGDMPFTMTAALHTYFAIGDVRQTHLLGLQRATYIDKLDGGNRHAQPDGPLAFAAETDRIYTACQTPVVIEDAANRRLVTVSREGSHSLVVWNPWIDKARRMADFPDDGYTEMLCVEACNAADDSIALKPGETHTLSTFLQATRLD